MKHIAEVISILIPITISFVVVHHQSNLIVPINLSEKQCVIEAKMQKMGYPKHLASSVKLASERSKLSPEFIIALMKSESDFAEHAISSKGYKGLMQIPHAVYDPDANILIGATIFVEKMRIAKGNTTIAICLYKGYAYDDHRGLEKARMVLKLYENLRKMEV